jgi:hypothetical protein
LRIISSRARRFRLNSSIRNTRHDLQSCASAERPVFDLLRSEVAIVVIVNLA